MKKTTKEQLIEDIEKAGNMGKITIFALNKLLDEIDFDKIDKYNNMPIELNKIISFINDSAPNGENKNKTRNTLIHCRSLFENDEYYNNLVLQNKFFSFLSKYLPKFDDFDDFDSEPHDCCWGFDIIQEKLIFNFSLNHNEQDFIYYIKQEIYHIIKSSNIPQGLLDIYDKFEENNFEGQKRKLTSLLSYLQNKNFDDAISIYLDSETLKENKNLFSKFLKMLNASNKDFDLEFFDKISLVNIHFKELHYAMTEDELILINEFIKTKNIVKFQELIDLIS